MYGAGTSKLTNVAKNKPGEAKRNVSRKKTNVRVREQLKDVIRGGICREASEIVTRTCTLIDTVVGYLSCIFIIIF